VSIVSATATRDHDRFGVRHRLPASLLRLASDERLVELLRGGSEPAFEALYARHHRGVLSFCRHMLGSAEEAEDALQHTFLDAFRDLLGSRKEIALRPWLYTIARNRCLTVLRARRERVDEQVEPSTEQLSDEVERRHDLRALLGDLAGLPDDQRAALVLAELGDLSHDEIGQALGCRREKVKALVFQARSSLIASRAARELPCDEVREQLANLRGGALRRNTLRRHLRECEGCREFEAQVHAQRRALALILPVMPSIGLKAAVLGGGTAAATGSIAAKTLVVLCVAGGGAAAVETVSDDRHRRPVPAPAAATPAAEVAERRAPAAAAPRVAGRVPVVARERSSRPKVLPPAPGKKAERAPKASNGPKIVPPGQAKKAERAPKANGPKIVPPGQAKKQTAAPANPGRSAKPAMPDKAKPVKTAKPRTVVAPKPPKPPKPPKVKPAKPAPAAEPLPPGQAGKQ
jgi:RNA polymerase sigma factor (sigma-70 family)